MKRLYIIPLLVVLLTVACDSPPENTGATGGNAQQANSNVVATAAQPQVAQNNNSIPAQPSPVAPTVQPAPTVPVAKSSDGAANKDANAAQPDPNAPAPKLVIPVKEIDFGKQGKDKTLLNAIRIKNGGKADLEIKSVEPG